jgi:hypothetical protein
MHLATFSSRDTLSLLLMSVEVCATAQLDKDQGAADMNRSQAHAQLDRLIDRLVKEAREDGEAERGGYARAISAENIGR